MFNVVYEDFLAKKKVKLSQFRLGYDERRRNEERSGEIASDPERAAINRQSVLRTEVKATTLERLSNTKANKVMMDTTIKLGPESWEDLKWSQGVNNPRKENLNLTLIGLPSGKYCKQAAHCGNSQWAQYFDWDASEQCREGKDEL